MLVLVILQIETSVVFVFNLRLHIAADVTRIISKEIRSLKVSRNPRSFEPVPWYWGWEQVETLVAAWQLRLITGLLHNFTLVKVGEGGPHTPHQGGLFYILLLLKFYSSSHFKIAYLFEDKSWHYCSCR